MVGKFCKMHTFFANNFSKRDPVSKKLVFQQGCTKGVAFHTSSSGIERPRNAKIIFVGRWSK